MAAGPQERTHTITLLAGDGIGPEVTDAVVRILEAAVAGTGAKFAWEPFSSAPTPMRNMASIFRRTCTTRSNETIWR